MRLMLLLLLLHSAVVCGGGGGGGGEAAEVDAEFELATRRLAGMRTPKAALDFIRPSGMLEEGDRNAQRVRYVAGCDRLAAIIGEGGEGFKGGLRSRFLRLIEKALRVERAQAMVCESCIHAVAALANRITTKKGAFGSERLLGAVMASMSRHSHELLIQERGANLLAKVALHNFNSSRAVICSSGGVDVLRAALENFPGSAEIQRWGLTSLRFLGTDVYDNNADAIPMYKEHRQLIEDSGLTPLLVVAMQIHPGFTPLQVEGLWALRMMATHSVPQKEAIKDAGGLEIVLGAMRTHPMDSGVQYGAIAVLQSLIGPGPNLEQAQNLQASIRERLRYNTTGQTAVIDTTHNDVYVRSMLGLC